MQVPNQAYILAVLLTCWVLMIGYQLLLTPKTKHVPLINRSGVSPESQTKEAKSVALDLQALISSHKENSKIPVKGLKNIFSPLSFPEMRKPVPSRKSIPQGPTIETLSESPPISSRDLAIERVRKEMAEYRFLGLVHEGDRSKVFLVHNQEIFIIEEGEVLKNDIRLVKIQPTSILLQYAETNITTIISLSDS